MSGHPSRKLEVFVLRLTIEVVHDSNGQKVVEAVRERLTSAWGTTEPVYNEETVTVSIQERHAYYGAKPRRKG